MRVGGMAASFDFSKLFLALRVLVERLKRQQRIPFFLKVGRQYSGWPSDWQGRPNPANVVLYAPLRGGPWEHST
jgi:hypothetical protein